MGTCLPERYIPSHRSFQCYITANAWHRWPIWVREALLTGKAQLGDLHRICMQRKMNGTLGTGDGWQYSSEGSHFWLDGQKVGPSIVPDGEKTIEAVRDLQGDLIYEAEWHGLELKKIKVPKTDGLAKKGSRIAMLLQMAYEVYVVSPESG